MKVLKSNYYNLKRSLPGSRVRTNRFHKETQPIIDLELLVVKNKTRNVKYLEKELTEPIITVTQPIKSVDPTRAVFPTFTTYEAMLEDDTHASNSRSFPEYSTCPYRGLRKPLVGSVSEKSQTPKCRRRLLTPSDCTDKVKYFGHHGTMKASQCDPDNAIKICTASQGENYKREEIKVSCDPNSCKGKRISLGLFSDTIGKIKWRTVKDIGRLSKLLRNHIMSSEYAPGFALLKCEGGQGIQVLSFPKVLDRMEPVQQEEKRRRFNINIVLEDSLSRAHFYRTLLKTASTFRDIIYNQSIPSTLLEFEKDQGYAPTTYNTLQRLFTGQKYWNSKTNCDQRVKVIPANDTMYSCTYGLEEMLGRYQRAGYSTLFQDDICWFDSWGSLLDPRKGIPIVKDEETRLRRWKEYVNILKKSGRWEVVGDYGMSILSCDAFKKYKLTNQYSSKTMPKICFAGRHYSSFFLEYVKKYTELNDMAAQPFLAYTHLLTSHDTTGTRIVNDDEGLADFFRHAAHLRNTVTIFMSDHGGKASDFAAYTTQGREEVFQPLLFMIIPHRVSKLLGPEVMNALVVNQDRLVGVEDLYHSLMSIIEIYQQSWESNTDPNLKTLIQHASPNAKNWVLREDPNGPYRKGVITNGLRGLFKPIPSDRTCEQMNIMSDALCLCEGMDTSVSSDDYFVQWAAEFALGTLNNRIQEQYTTALRSKSGVLASGFYGYGACQRYVGSEIMSARKIIASSEEKLIFSILAKPFDKKREEIFDVEVSFPTKRNSRGMALNNLIRVSRFNEYEKCTDEGVQPSLCTCHADQRNNTEWKNELYSKILSQENFKLKPRREILDQPCLTIISRGRQHAKAYWKKAIKTYEAVNACPDVTYKLIISFKKLRETRISLKHPKSVSLLPRTVTFLLTANNIEDTSGRFIPTFQFEKRKWR